MSCNWTIRRSNLVTSIDQATCATFTLVAQVNNNLIYTRKKSLLGLNYVQLRVKYIGLKKKDSEVKPE